VTLLELPGRLAARNVWLHDVIDSSGDKTFAVTYKPPRALTVNARLRSNPLPAPFLWRERG
jgi:hypothetical protein